MYLFTSEQKNRKLLMCSTDFEERLKPHLGFRLFYERTTLASVAPMYAYTDSHVMQVIIREMTQSQHRIGFLENVISERRCTNSSNLRFFN